MWGVGKTRKEDRRRRRRQKREGKVADSHGRGGGTKHSHARVCGPWREKAASLWHNRLRRREPPTARRARGSPWALARRGRTSRVDRVPIVHALLHLKKHSGVQGNTCLSQTWARESSKRGSWAGCRMPKPHSGTRRAHNGASTSGPRADVPPAVATEGEEASQQGHGAEATSPSARRCRTTGNGRRPQSELRATASTRHNASQTRTNTVHPVSKVKKKHPRSSDRYVH